MRSLIKNIAAIFLIFSILFTMGFGLGDKSIALAEGLDEVVGISPMAIIDPGPGDYDVADNHLTFEVQGSSNNNHTQLLLAWDDEDGNFYFAVQSTHELGGQMTVVYGGETITSDETHIYGNNNGVIDPITVGGTEYPDKHPSVNGNTGDTRWTVYKFEDVSLTAGTYTFSIIGIGGGHDIKNATLIISVPKIDIDVSKVWVGGEGPRPDIELQLYIDEDPVDGTSVILVYPETTYTWVDMDAADENGVIYNYTVRERPIDGYETEVTGDLEGGFIVTNTFIPYIPVTILKEVTGNFGDISRDFSFTVSVAGGASYDFNLKDGESYPLAGIRPSDVLTLTEESNGYDVTVMIGETEYYPNVDNEYIINLSGYDSDITIRVINNKDVIIDTGLTLDSLPYFLLLAAVGIGLSVMIVRKRKIYN